MALLGGVETQGESKEQRMKHYIFDCEVFAHDWLVVIKPVGDDQYYYWMHNDNDSLKQFIEDSADSVLCGFNCKHYDNYILKAILADFTPEEVKQVNDYIIQGGEGWNCPLLKDIKTMHFNTTDLFDDCQQGLSLKAIEAHLGMDIQETGVDFNLARSLTPAELDQTLAYCMHDVDATERLYHLRKSYLDNKVQIGAMAGLSEAESLRMTNAKLTAALLKAQKQPHFDEREYKYPANLKREYIPTEVFEFFDRLQDKSLSDEEVFSGKLELMIGECPCVLGYGGIHGAIPNYVKEANDE